MILYAYILIVVTCVETSIDALAATCANRKVLIQHKATNVLDYKIGSTSTQTAYQCFESCLYIGMCKSVSFHTLKKQCNFNCASVLESKKSLRTDKDYVTIDKSENQEVCKIEICMNTLI